MIDSKIKLKEVLKIESSNRRLKKVRFHHLFSRPLAYYTKVLRTYEYLCNTNSIFAKLYSFYFKMLSIYFGFTIPINVFDSGFYISHWGNIVVAKGVKVGKNCRMHSGVCIGTKNDVFPEIGNNVYFGPGSKMFGPIKIGDNVKIGANAVVTKSFPDNSIVAGVPAKLIGMSKVVKSP